MIVLDASAAADFVIRRGERGAWAADAVRSRGSLQAPHLIDFEVTSSLRGLVLGGRVPAARAREALADFQKVRLTRYPAAALLDRIWDLRAALTAYDAAYVALAEALGVPLVTTDVRLARSRGHDAEIVAYGP